MKRKTRLVFSVWFAVGLVGGISAAAQSKVPADRPQYRGSGGLGVSGARGLPITWSEQQNVVWKTERPGPGGSSPVVWGNGVFLTSHTVSSLKTYAMQAYKIMHGLWGMGQTCLPAGRQVMFTKYFVVVDGDVDVHNTSDVLFRLCANTDPQRDSIFTKGPADVRRLKLKRLKARKKIAQSKRSETSAALG